MSWTQVHALATAAARASLDQEIRKARGLEVTAKPSAWREIHKSGRVRLFVGAPRGIYWKDAAFFVVDASLDTEVLSNRHVVSYRSYAQLAYGFNYYGTVGSNRDEFVVLRKMKTVDWLEEPRSDKENG